MTLRRRTFLSTFRAVLFDLDGTLVDTLDDIAAGVNAGLHAVGLAPRGPGELRAMVGSGVTTLLQHLLPAALEPRLPEVRRVVIDHYRDHVGEHSVVYPGIEEMLDGLAERGISCAVLTNKPQDVAAELVSRLFGSERFPWVRGLVEEASRKPDPRGALFLAERLGLEAERVLLVGDSEVDIRTARNAGMGATAVSWGFRDRPELEAERPDWIVDRPGELLERLDDAKR